MHSQKSLEERTGGEQLNLQDQRQSSVCRDHQVYEHDRYGQRQPAEEHCPGGPKRRATHHRLQAVSGVVNTQPLDEA